MNPMKQVRIEKVTVNMGVGQAGEELKKGTEILSRITGKKPVQTICKVRQPTWGLRIGLPIGVKVTLRKSAAQEFLKTALAAKDNKLPARCFDKFGNFGFGIKEYIDMPGAKYDPKLGIRGFDVLVTLQKPGFRIKRRKIRTQKVAKNHTVKPEEAMDFVKQTFNVAVE